ncbi:MAG: hypothetical protein U1D55_18485 [Phycisphaerae bacterium]
MLQADRAKVKIDGGPDETRQNYVWKITNYHSSPIVYVEFPSHFADVFVAPNGWKSDTSAGDKCVASTSTPEAGIRDSAQFTMRVSTRQPPTGRGTVRVRFADGSEYLVPDVQVPRGQTVPERLATPAALITALAILIATARRRARRDKKSDSTDDETRPPDSTAL